MPRNTETDAVYGVTLVQDLCCDFFTVPETDMRDSPWHEASPPTSEDGSDTAATGLSPSLYFSKWFHLYAASET
jgi:hypothetical protein